MDIDLKFIKDIDYNMNLNNSQSGNVLDYGISVVFI